MAKPAVNVNTKINGKDWTIEGVPAAVWDQFTERAKELMPEAGDRAWASFIGEVIASVVDGETKTLILSDIPRMAWDGFVDAANSAALTPYQLIATMIACAAKGHFHAVHFTNGLANPHAVTMVGISPQAWEAFASISKKELDLSPEDLFARLIQAAHDGTLEFQAHKSETPDSPN